MRPLTILSATALVTSLGSMAGAATMPAGFSTLDGAAPIVIGHRGAPAYLPENSIGGNELAADMGSDFIETDVMLAADDVLVVMHDASLERTTDVEEVYEPRNGGYAVADFTSEEIGALTVEPGSGAATTYPGFTPMADDPYKVPTFARMLDALTAYNAENGTDIGMLTEGKYADDEATSRAVIETLIEKGYTTPEMSAVQSFGFGNVAAYADILDELGVEMGVAQLGGANFVDGEWRVGDTVSIADLAGYTDTVAVSAGSITEGFIDAAHAEGLGVYGWTFRPESAETAITDVAPFLDWGLDGFITDNPDYVGAAIAASQVAPVPLPAGLPLLTLALAGLGGWHRARRRAP